MDIATEALLKFLAGGRPWLAHAACNAPEDRSEQHRGVPHPGVFFHHPALDFDGTEDTCLTVDAYLQTLGRPVQAPANAPTVTDPEQGDSVLEGVEVRAEFDAAIRGEDFADPDDSADDDSTNDEDFVDVEGAVVVDGDAAVAMQVATGPAGELLTLAVMESLRDQVEAAALSTCVSCPVLSQCREWSLTNQVAGVSGGLTEAQRLEIEDLSRDAREALQDVSASSDEDEEADGNWLEGQVNDARVAELTLAGWSSVRIARELGADPRTIYRARARARTQGLLSTPA